MKTELDTALTASAPARTASAAADVLAAQQQAWLRVMEQTQCTDWLQHGLLPASARPEVAASAADSSGQARQAASTQQDNRASPAASWPRAMPSHGAQFAAAATARTLATPAASPHTAEGAAPQAQSQHPVQSPDSLVAEGIAAPPALTVPYAGTATLGLPSPAAPGLSGAAAGSAAAALQSMLAASLRELAPQWQAEFSVSVAPPAGATVPGLPGAAAPQAGTPSSQTGPVEEDAAADAPAPLADERPASAPADAGAGAEDTPLRLHAEWSPQGVRIWIGAVRDSQLDANGLTQLRALLQRSCDAQARRCWR
jgi:hypothetical protein